MTNFPAILTLTLLTWRLLAAPAAAQQLPAPADLPWGGQIVAPEVPYQPSALFVPPNGDQTPLLLEQDPNSAEPTWHLASLTTEVVPGDVDYLEVDQAQLPPGARDGIFQKMYFTGTYLPQLDDDSLGWGDLESGVVFGFPFFRRETPLLVTPWFGVHYLDGPNTPDLPARVYDAAVEFRHLRKFGDGPWAMDVAVTTGYYSDFEQSDADAFRVTGRGLAVYESTPGTKWVAGVAYLNRAGASVLPVGGVIYEPTADMKWELIFPKPKIAWRLPASVPDCDERWVYIGGEFGGGIWSIERPITLTQDLVTYQDFRVLAGYERKITGGLSRRFEVGYVFGRELEFDSATPDVELDDTLFVRAGLTY